jgi:hypothetical protein
MGSEHSGVLEIRGCAARSDFQRYELFWRKSSEPDSALRQLESSSSLEVCHGVLATWDTSSLDDGQYYLKLVVIGVCASLPHETEVKFVVRRS